MASYGKQLYTVWSTRLAAAITAAVAVAVTAMAAATATATAVAAELKNKVYRARCV